MHFPYVCMGLGLSAMLILFLLLIRRWWFMQHSEKVLGQVVDMVYQENYFPVVSFVTKQGRQMRVQYHVGTNPPIIRVGSQIAVYYNANQPEQILLPLDLVTGSLYFIVFLITLALSLLGLILLIL